MKLPKIIKIGPYKFNVKEETLNKHTTDEVWGSTLIEEQGIYIEVKQGVDGKADTLLHETLHGVFFVAGVKVDDEEDIIKSIAPHLLSVLRENPSLVQYLLGE